MLGLGNYATDDDEIHISSLPNSRNKKLQHSNFENSSEDKHDVGANGSLVALVAERCTQDATCHAPRHLASLEVEEGIFVRVSLYFTFSVK